MCKREASKMSVRELSCFCRFYCRNLEQTFQLSSFLCLWTGLELNKWIVFWDVFHRHTNIELRCGVFVFLVLNFGGIYFIAVYFSSTIEYFSMVWLFYLYFIILWYNNNFIIVYWGKENIAIIFFQYHAANQDAKFLYERDHPFQWLQCLSLFLTVKLWQDIKLIMLEKCLHFKRFSASYTPKQQWTALCVTTLSITINLFYLRLFGSCVGNIVPNILRSTVQHIQ